MRLAEKLNFRNKSISSQRPPTIVCLGDSVTHGCFELVRASSGGIDTSFRPDDGYPTLLERGLRFLYPAAAVSVINAGISGDSAQGGLKRLERDVLSFKPDLVTVNYALNDAMNPDVEAGLCAYSSNMRELFSKILASGAEAILVTPNVMCDYATPKLSDTEMRDIAERVALAYNAGTLRKYVAAAKEVAAEMGVPVADANAVWEDMRASGIDTTEFLANYINHPVKEMHALFAQKIIEEIIKR